MSNNNLNKQSEGLPGRGVPDEDGLIECLGGTPVQEISKIFYYFLQIK